MSVPSEPEIRAFAEAIGAVDEHGRYTSPRSALAAGAVEYRKEQQKIAERADLFTADHGETTAARLARFERELIAYRVQGRHEIVAAVAGALVRRDGLLTEREPRNE